MQAKLFDYPRFRRIKQRLIKKLFHLDFSIGLQHHSEIISAHHFNRENLIIKGTGVWIEPNVYIDITGKVVIEDHVLISQNAIIWTHDHDFKTPEDRLEKCPAYMPYVPSDIHIERNCWIGSRVIIPPSCNRIGEGSIVAAGAVVTKNVPAFSIVAGIIRQR